MTLSKWWKKIQSKWSFSGEGGLAAWLLVPWFSFLAYGRSELFIKVFIGWIILSPEQCHEWCPNSAGNRKHWLEPVTWLRLLFISQRTPRGRGVVPFLCQLSDISYKDSTFHHSMLDQGKLLCTMCNDHCTMFWLMVWRKWKYDVQWVDSRYLSFSDWVHTGTELSLLTHRCATDVWLLSSQP